MKTFIKQNWFRIIIVLMFGTYLFSNINFSNNDVFIKKQECSKYYDLANNKIKDSGRVMSNETYTLNEVFYSPKMDTCLYAYTINTPIIKDSIYTIDDVFGGGVTVGIIESEFIQKISELKK